jgi:beta-xylosidase
VLELARDGLSVKRQVVQIDRSKYRLFEGPDIFKHGGWYYRLLSDGGTLPHEPSAITTLRARQLGGPWELIDTPAGEWFVTYHARLPASRQLKSPDADEIVAN